jgi:hypothetical protein
MEKVQTEREKMITKILELSGDEFETVADVLKLAIETDYQLTKRIIYLQNNPL